MKPHGATRAPGIAPISLGLMILITLAGFALRAHDLGAKSFWYDELRQIEVARLPLPDWAEALKLHAARPLDYLITRALLNFARSEWLLRFPALAWGTLAIPIVFQLGRSLLGRREGVIGAFLFALSSVGVMFSQELRPYSLYALASTASFWMLERGLRRGTASAWFLYALSLGLGVLTHYFWLVILAGQVAYVVLAAALRRFPRQRLAPFAACLGAGVAVLFLTADPEVVLPLAGNFIDAIVSAVVAHRPPAVSLRAPGVNPFAPNLTYDFFVNRILGQMGAGAGGLILYNGLFLIGLAGCVGQTRPRSTGRLLFLLTWLLLGPGLIVTYLIYRNEIFAIRYILFAVPPYLLMVARGIVTSADWVERMASRWGAAGRPAASGASLVALVAVTWLNARYVASYYQTPKDDWRRLGEFLAANVQPGDAIYAPNVQSFVEYYFPNAEDYLVYADGKREAQYAYAQHSRTWFVVSDWVTSDVTDTRRLIDLLPGITFQWDATSFVKFTHRGESEAQMQSEAQTFTIPPPSLRLGDRH